MQSKGKYGSIFKANWHVWGIICPLNTYTRNGCAAPGTGGTARLAHAPGLEICGKTGTAQNPHGKDNAVFICFAPRENPRIAIAAYIENAGFGGTWAAPIASLMIEKYLNGETSRPDLELRMKEANLLRNVPVKRR